MRVQDVMTKRVRTLKVNETTEAAQAVLHFWNHRHLPILDANDRVVGMITPTDLLEAIRKTGTTSPIPVSQVMHRPAITIRQDESLETAVQQMRRASIHDLPVVDWADRLVGIVTDVDLLVAMVRDDRPRGID